MRNRVKPILAAGTALIAPSTRLFARAISCRATMIGTLLLATVVPARAELTYNTDQTADGTSVGRRGRRVRGY